jgi:tripartite-type tricarboxylate transporter receptor subunit TctC
MRRRAFLRLAAAAALPVCALPVCTRPAAAQSYPTRPVRLIVGYSAGGTADIVARIIAQRLTERLGQPVVVENKPGATTNIATQAVISAAPDGHTLLYVTAANATNASLYSSLPFNFQRDIVPVAGLVEFTLVLVVNAALPVHSIGEFVAYARANPGKISMASFGVGTTSHLSGELLKLVTGIDTVHVPYRGGAPMITDLVSGQVQAAFDALPEALPHIRTGALRPLAVTTAARADSLLEVPTIGDTIPGYEASSWAGLGAPRGTPPAVIETLRREAAAALGNPAIRARLDDLGSTPWPLGPDAFGAYIAAETEKWAKVVKFAGVKAE